MIPAPWVGALGLLLGCSGPAKPSVVIDHVTVVDVVTGALHQDQMVRIEGRWIQAITSSHEARAARGTTQVDGTGKYLIPGLWDMHVHLGGSEPWLGVLVAFGITSSISWVFPYAPTSWPLASRIRVAHHFGIARGTTVVQVHVEADRSRCHA